MKQDRFWLLRSIRNALILEIIAFIFIWMFVTNAWKGAH